MKNNKESENKLWFSYLVYPDVRLENYEEGERVILLLRAHPFTQLPWIFNTFIFVITAIFANFFLSQFLSFNRLFVFNCFVIVFILSFIWFNILNWYFNVGILTNKRLIDIDFSSILYREMTIARLDKIEDITIKSGGYFGSLFDFGSIYIQTAGMENYIEFNDIPYPSLVVEKINNLITKKNAN